MPSRQELSLPEEIMLLALHDEKGTTGIERSMNMPSAVRCWRSC